MEITYEFFVECDANLFELPISLRYSGGFGL